MATNYNEHNMITFSSIVLDNSTTKKSINPANGQMNVEECLLTEEEVVKYTVGVDFPLLQAEKDGFKQGDIVQIYRPLHEIKRALPFYRMLPLLLDHEMVDSKTLEYLFSRSKKVNEIIERYSDHNERDAKLKEMNIEVIGTIGSDPYIKGKSLFNALSVWTENGKSAVNDDGKNRLSVGYLTDYVREDGVYEGKSYHYKQTNIRCNHVTICYMGRCESAHVSDSLSIFNQKEKELAVNKATAQQQQVFNAATAQDNSSNGSTIPEIQHLYSEVTNPPKAIDSADPEAKVKDNEPKKNEETNEPTKNNKDNKAEDGEGDKDDKDKEKKAEDNKENEPKEPAKDNKDKAGAMDAKALDAMISERVTQEVNRRLAAQAMDAQHSIDVKQKLADFGFAAMDSMNSSVALTAGLQALVSDSTGKANQQLVARLAKADFMTKKLVLDSIHEREKNSTVYMDESVITQSSASDSVSQDDVNKFGGA
jgi:hypothetical protein